MYGKKKINIVLWLICLMLCGCTRREQLMETEDSALSVQDAAEDISAAEEEPSGGEDVRPEESSGLSSGGETDAGEIPAGSADAEAAGEPQTIWVHVCGAVKEPDVYELPAGSRVYEAVQAAGGFAEDADSNYVNQVQKLSDGVKLVIPTTAQTEELAAQEKDGAVVGVTDAGTETADSGGSPATSAGGRVNINTASEAELCNIPGIGKTRAAAIVAYRQEKGGFTSIEDIMNVSGIKEGTYEKIKDTITVK